MLNGKKMEEIRQKDAQKMGEVRNKTEEIAALKITAIHEKAQALKDQIQKLVDRKGDIFTQPSSKAETVALAKEALREQRERFFFEELLVSQLKDCQNCHYTFLSQNSIRLFWERHGWRFIYWIIKEEDIEKASEMLPNIGLSEAERNAQIEKIDKEITKLEDQIEMEFKKL